MFQARDKLKKKNSELKAETLKNKTRKKQSKQDFFVSILCDFFVSIPQFKFSVLLSILIKLCCLIPFQNNY